MQSTYDDQRKLYVGMHDRVCALSSTDAGKTWQQGPVTPLAHAAARLSTSTTAPQRAYLAAYEAGVYRTDDGGLTWRHLASYPSDYAHSVLVHPQDARTVRTPSRIFASTLEELSVICMIGELGVANDQPFELSKIHEIHEIVVKLRNELGIVVDASPGSRRGMLSAPQEQIVCEIKKV